MKPVVLGLALAAVACGRLERIDSTDRRPIDSPPPYLAGVNTNLHVPASCPVWAPGGGDVDTPEPPLPAQLSALCAVDELGGTYGIILGDAPTAHLAVIPGAREVGVFVGFSPGTSVVDRVTVDGGSQTVDVWTNSASMTAALRPTQIVAFGDTGVLISVGRFEADPIEVRFNVRTDVLFGTIGWYGAGFDVNAAPAPPDAGAE